MQSEVTPQTSLEILSKVDIFHHLPVSVLENISRKLVLRTYHAGEGIIAKGEKGNCMFVIFEGQVKVHDEGMEVASFSKGNFFGEFSLLDDEPRSMSVTAKTEAVIAAIFQSDFYEVLNLHPEVTKDVMKTLIKRLRMQNGQIISQMKQREEVLEALVKERTMEVIQQKVLVETKNKEILDSINYAKRLQDAILPATTLIREYFPESFVLYKPKDIVAGDFYWMNASGGMVLMIAADCTGHGVSGALMSMLGVSLLNQIVNEMGITNPSSILDQLHISIVKALNQDANNSHEGMDIAVCGFDLKTNELQFSGANLPLWIVRNNEMDVIAFDKVPIGGLQIERKQLFTNNTIRLNKGDVVYLSTDGYADQFGGAQGKKLMKKNFKKILLGIRNENSEVQKKYLAEYFENWKGNNEQTDDVLVIGIRI